MLETETLDISDEELEKARQRGEQLWRTEPRARSVKYDKKSRRVRLDFTNGSTFWFPPGIIQGLEHASPEQVERATLVGDGYAVHWEELDVGIPVTALLAGRFGNDRFMAELAAKTAPPPTTAKGGRPAKTETAPPGQATQPKLKLRT
jgi:hypothetical protein